MLALHHCNMIIIYFCHSVVELTEGLSPVQSGCSSQFRTVDFIIMMYVMLQDSYKSYTLMGFCPMLNKQQQLHNNM